MCIFPQRMMTTAVAGFVAKLNDDDDDVDAVAGDSNVALFHEWKRELLLVVLFNIFIAFSPRFPTVSADPMPVQIRTILSLSFRMSVVR